MSNLKAPLMASRTGSFHLHRFFRSGDCISAVALAA